MSLASVESATAFTTMLNSALDPSRVDQVLSCLTGNDGTFHAQNSPTMVLHQHMINDNFMSTQPNSKTSISYRSH